MKVLITGATGTIGGAILEQCIKHPEVSSIVAYSRRPLPDAAVASNSKVAVHIVKDFSKWTPEMLEAAKGADAMVWSLGLPNDDVAVNYDYPLAFQTAFTQDIKSSGRTTPFRFIIISGKFVTQDQDATLFFMGGARKLRGRTELKSTELAEAAKDVWRTCVLRPGFVLDKKDEGGIKVGLQMVMGNSWAIRADELGAFATDLAVRGPESRQMESSLTFENAAMLARGRELLKS